MLGGGGGLTCEQCEKLGSQDSFAKGSKVKIKGVYDCENCEIFKSQPIWENENILELYNALPSNFDGATGERLFSASDLKFLFELYEVPEELWYDYYQRILFLHNELLKLSRDKREKDTKKKQEAKDWLTEQKRKKREGGTEH